jgi:8-oxo-dGTP diphosphatase
MTVEDGEFTPTDEVDELRWVSPKQAKFLLSYDRDRVVLDEFLKRRR